MFKSCSLFPLLKKEVNWGQGTSHLMWHFLKLIIILQKYITVNSNSKRTSEVRLIDAHKPRARSFLDLHPLWPRRPGVEYFINHSTVCQTIHTFFKGVKRGWMLSRET